MVICKDHQGGGGVTKGWNALCHRCITLNMTYAPLKSFRSVKVCIDEQCKKSLLCHVVSSSVAQGVNHLIHVVVVTDDGPFYECAEVSTVASRQPLI